MSKRPGLLPPCHPVTPSHCSLFTVLTVLLRVDVHATTLPSPGGARGVAAIGDSRRAIEGIVVSARAVDNAIVLKPSIFHCPDAGFQNSRTTVLLERNRCGNKLGVGAPIVAKMSRDNTL